MKCIVPCAFLGDAPCERIGRVCSRVGFETPWPLFPLVVGWRCGSRCACASRLFHCRCLCRNGGEGCPSVTLFLIRCIDRVAAVKAPRGRQAMHRTTAAGKFGWSDTNTIENNDVNPFTARGGNRTHRLASRAGRGTPVLLAAIAAVLAALLAPAYVEAGLTATQQNALVDVFTSLGGPSWTAKVGWPTSLATAADPCVSPAPAPTPAWTGVTCSSGKLVYVPTLSFGRAA